MSKASTEISFRVRGLCCNDRVAKKICKEYSASKAKYFAVPAFVMQGADARHVSNYEKFVAMKTKTVEDSKVVGVLSDSYYNWFLHVTIGLVMLKQVGPKNQLKHQQETRGTNCCEPANTVINKFDLVVRLLSGVDTRCPRCDKGDLSKLHRVD